MIWQLVGASSAGVAAGLMFAPLSSGPEWRGPRPGGGPVGQRRAGLVARGRWLWTVLAFGAGCVVGPGVLAIPLGVACAFAVRRLVDRVESPAIRSRREAVRRELPHLVELFATALAAGSAPATALTSASRALPGAVAEELRDARTGLHLGRSQLEVWRELGRHPQLSALGRTMARAERSGAPVVQEVRRLADDLAAEARVDLEDRARAVGVKAALPLGLCLLPAFLLTGIVPLVVGAAGAIQW